MRVSSDSFYVPLETPDEKAIQSLDSVDAMSRKIIGLSCVTASALKQDISTTWMVRCETFKLIDCELRLVNFVACCAEMSMPTFAVDSYPQVTLDVVLGELGQCHNFGGALHDAMIIAPRSRLLGVRFETLRRKDAVAIDLNRCCTGLNYHIASRLHVSTSKLSIACGALANMGNRQLPFPGDSPWWQCDFGLAVRHKKRRHNMSVFLTAKCVLGPGQKRHYCHCQSCSKTDQTKER
jgi:hypothetical protein